MFGLGSAGGNKTALAVVLWAAAIGLGVFAATDMACARSPAVVPGAAPGPQVVYDGADGARPRIAIRLLPIAQGLTQPTDVQAVPGQPGLLVVLEKTGTARWIDVTAGALGAWFRMDVLTRSEQGLLGIAFHPGFARSGRFFVHASVTHAGDKVGEISEWRSGGDPRKTAPTKVKVLLRVKQPYANHDAGQLQFGPDGKLYVGFGDGGAANDPLEHGQNRDTFLGSMLRLDVDAGDPYSVPADNPWGTEVWAYGLRNPWRFSFAPDGRLVVGDVGQNKFEEVTIVARGENHGWNLREAAHCFPPGRDCEQGSMVDPVYEYGREEGTSITGGYVYTGKAVAALKGKYVFGDFTTGRLWALDLPSPKRPLDRAHTLGRWRINPATFGRGHDGELYVADFSGGVLYRVAPGS